MNRSLKSKYHFLIALLFGIIALETAFLLYAVAQAKDLYTLAGDIHSIILVFVFGLFVYIMVLYNYIPFRLHKAIREIGSLVDSISNGNYQLDIDSSVYDQDTDFQDLIYGLEKMLGIIMRFDSAKAEKIFEHHQRIQLLINLLPESILIVGANGDVVYCNENMRKRFPTISEMVNLNEVIWNNDYHARIFSVLMDAIRYGNNIYNVLVDDLIYLGKATINGSIVRNRKGLSTGAVYVLEFSEPSPAQLPEDSKNSK
jgi:signal transduction histidine kinase